jgi:hypothetical protein
VRRRLIGSNPFDHLTADDRPVREEKAQPYEWSDEDVEALLQASTQLAGKPESRYDYTPLLRLVATLGLRIGEVLGLWWEDFDKDGGFLHVRRQWKRDYEYGPTKTPAGVRRLALPVALRDELIALRLRSNFSQDEHPIFASHNGTPLGHRNVSRRGFEAARDLTVLPSSHSPGVGPKSLTTENAETRPALSGPLSCSKSATRQNSTIRPFTAPFRGPRRRRKWLKCWLRARSSAGEHSLHTRGVAGSIPAAPISELPARCGLHEGVASPVTIS